MKWPMRRGVGRSLALALALHSACAPEATESSHALAPAPIEWRDAGALEVDGNFGTSDEVTLTVPPNQRFLAIRVTPLHATAAPLKQTVCYQLDKVTTGAGERWVDNSRKSRDWAKSCKKCNQRVVSSPGAGIFVFPNDGASLGEPGTLGLRVVLRDCATGVAADVGLNPDLPARVHVQWASETEAVGVIDRLDVAMMNLPQAPWPAAAQRAQAILRDAGLFATFRHQDDEQLSHERVVAIRGASCASMPASAGMDLLGSSPRIPGGMTPQQVVDGVFIATDFCGKPALDEASAARLLAHEIGHYLGLFHSDAEESNHRKKASELDIMNSAALGKAKPLTFSSAQLEVMRRHPFTWQAP